MSTILAGLRHAITFAAFLAFTLILVAMPPAPSPEGYSFIFHFRMAVGFISGWMAHGLYRLILVGWEEYKLERARKIIAAGAIVVAALLLMPTGAEARECARYGIRLVHREFPHYSYRERYCKYWVQGERYRLPAGETYSYLPPRHDRDEDRWERRDPQSERGVQCKDSGPIRVVGGKHLTQPGAIKDAVGRWESSVGYDHGEKFANMENARNYRWRCDKASTNETALGRVGENIANAVTGGNADAYYKRCVVMATPCMQPVMRGDKDER